MTSESKLKAFQCPTCSAPLSVKPEDAQIQCSYCHNTIQIKHKKREKSDSTDKLTLYIPPAQGFSLSTYLVLIFLFGIVPALLGGGYYARRGTGFGVTKLSLPGICPANAKCIVDGKKFTASNEEPILKVEGNATLTIKDSQLKGATIIKTEGNTSIIIKNSSLESTVAGIDAAGNNHIFLEEKSIIKATSGTGILTEGNGKIHIKNASLEGEKGIELGSNGEIKADAATISTQKENVEFKGLGKASFKKGILNAGGTALLSNNSFVEISLDGTKITAGMSALDVNKLQKLEIFNGASISSIKTTVLAGGSTEVILKDSTVKSEQGTGLQFGFVTRLQIKNSTVQGAKAYVAKSTEGEPQIENPTFIGSIAGLKGWNKK